MKKITILLILISLLGLNSCSKSEKTLATKIYTASAYNSSGVSGTITFKEKSDGTTTIEVMLDGVTSGKTYPMHIHNGSASSPGTVAIDLTAIAASGHLMKTLDVTNKYSDMLVFDGVFVAHNPDDVTKYIVVKNIGKNE